MIRVGYLEGTDSLFLNELIARGMDTVPLSNGVDNHGKFIGHLSKADDISIVVGFLHKVVPLADSNLTPRDMLHSCQLHDIPVLVIAQKSIHARAKEILGRASKFAKLVDPIDLMETFKKVVG